jgi:hypothetical protein
VNGYIFVYPDYPVDPVKKWKSLVSLFFTHSHSPHQDPLPLPGFLPLKDIFMPGPFLTAVKNN